MKNIILALLMACQITNGVNASVIVDRIEDNNIAVVEVAYGEEIKMADVPAELFNYEVKQSQRIDFQTIYGKFYNTMETIHDGKIETMYQFRSFDNSVWWLLSEAEIGFIPNNSKTYVLMYCDNGTTAENKTCGCPAEYECECEVYDDIFLGIFEKSSGNFGNIYPNLYGVSDNTSNRRMYVYKWL